MLTYRQKLYHLLKNNDKRDDVLSVFEKWMENESNNEYIAACEALSEYRLDGLIKELKNND